MEQPNRSPAATTEAARALHGSVGRLSRQLLAARGAGSLSVSKLDALGYLLREGPCTATELAAYLRIQPQSLTRLLAALALHGLVERRPDEVDRRQIQIAITGRGTAALRADVRERGVRLAQAMAKTLTPAEQGILALASGLIDRLADGLAASHDAHPGELEERQAS